MSSESDEYRPPRLSSTPETPRKRRRASTASSRQRSHKQPRRHDVESHYSDKYRVFFNEHVENAASRFEVNKTARDITSQIGSSLWTAKEKAVFFAALERLGRDDLPGIAGAIGTKSEAETRAFLVTLQDATAERGDSKLTLRDIPAAIELGRECNQQLERAADALAWYQERHEASLEQERYGKYWLITSHIADNIDEAINGVVRPRSASTPYELEPNRAGSGVAGSCISCKTRKVKCDRASPCGRCVRNDRDCEYSEKKLSLGKSDNVPRSTSRPRSASGLADSEPDQLGPGFVGACIACRNGKRKCDRGTPCDRCTLLDIECQYARLNGKGVAGACERCRKYKAKCDRNMPCANCSRSESECVYANSVYHGISRQPTGPSPAPTTKVEDEDHSSNLPRDDDGEPQMLQAIPEATLLDPKMMLSLSRNLFMNHSSEFPSPWPHWSEYTSELAAEPSIYRTAFNDFHRLAISVTKRLVRTAIMQAESRLRSQRPRATHQVQPFIKKRDVRAAIDVLGLARDGNDRWKGVARRCGVKVLTSIATSRGKRSTVVPWDEVERVLSADVSRDSRPATDVESSTEPEDFKRRAARSGTPLPMQNLTLSDSEDEIEPDSVVDDDDEELVERFADVTTGRQHTLARDTTGRFMSVPPNAEMDDAHQQLRTLEDFDHEASRQEEQALWDMLGIRPRNDVEITISDDEPHNMDSEKLVSRDHDWQHTTDYRAPWETYTKPLSTAKFITNRKSLTPMPATNDEPLPGSRSPSGNMSDGSSTSGARRPRRRSPKAVELRARGATAYAALQREELVDSDRDDNSSSPDPGDDEDDPMEQDIPTQSIEAHDDSSDY